MIYQLCEERRLPHMRVGAKGRRGKLLINRRDVDAFLESVRICAQ
jgi:hypothetical protein